MICDAAKVVAKLDFVEWLKFIEFSKTYKHKHCCWCAVDFYTFKRNNYDK